MPCTKSQLVPLYPILHQQPEAAWLEPAPERRAVPPELPAGGSRLPAWIPVPCHGSLAPTLHPHLGKGWTWHRHKAPWAHWGGEGAPLWPQWGLQPSATAGHDAHSHPSLPPACAAPGTCPRGRLRHSGQQNPWSWGSAAPMSRWLPRGIPCALLGAQQLSGATSSLQTKARPLSPAHRAGVGRGRSRSAPPRPSRWILYRAHAAPCQTTSAQSLSVPGVLTALQHHPWLG